jgi:hypothetical protein
MQGSINYQRPSTVSGEAHPGIPPKRGGIPVFPGWRRANSFELRSPAALARWAGLQAGAPEAEREMSWLRALLTVSRHHRTGGATGEIPCCTGTAAHCPGPPPC